MKLLMYLYCVCFRIGKPIFHKPFGETFQCLRCGRHRSPYDNFTGCDYRG